MVNVGKYTIHGSYGCQKRSIDHVEPPVFRSSDLSLLTTLVSDSTSSVPSMTPEFFPSGVKSKLGMFHKKSRKFWRNRGNFRRKERKNGSRRPIFPKCTNLFRNTKMNHPTNPTNLGKKDKKPPKNHHLKLGSPRTSRARRPFSFSESCQRKQSEPLKNPLTFHYTG